MDMQTVIQFISSGSVLSADAFLKTKNRFIISTPTVEQRWMEGSKMHSPTKLGIVLFLGILAIFLGAVFDAIGV